MAHFKKASEIKVGVVGYGGAYNMGRKHLEEMKAAGMTPVAVAEIDQARRKIAKDEFPGIETYASLSTMLKKSEINLITIITPHNTHAKLCLEALKAGRHVVVEKPFAITTAECDAVISEAKKRKLVASTYHNRHWDGCILQAMKTIRKGAIGDIVRIEAHMGGYGDPGTSWRASRSISGGILYDWGVHLLEYSLQMLTDAKIREVSGNARHGFWAAKNKWGKDTIEDEAQALVRFDTGQWLSLVITRIDSHQKDSTVEITGTKGSYLMNLGDWQMIRQIRGKAVETKGKNPENEGWRFYKNIADHLAKGKELVITPEWARRPIHILDLATKSAKQGKALKAKYC